jgi:hypothetical protein
MGCARAALPAVFFVNATEQTGAVMVWLVILIIFSVVVSGFNDTDKRLKRLEKKVEQSKSRKVLL